MFYRLQEKAGGLIKLVDIAPEVDGAIDCIKKIKDDVRVSVAHTAATYDQAKEAFDNNGNITNEGTVKFLESMLPTYIME